MAGIGYVGLCLLVAILGPVIAPDSSPYANIQVLELAKKPPGAQAQLLLIPLQAAEEPSMFSRLISGTPFPYRPVPLVVGSGLSQQDSLLVFTPFPSGELEKMNLSDFGPNASVSSIQEANLLDRTFWLGTDAYGRDVLSRLLLGSRVSLAIGILAVLLSLAIGVSLGLMAGFFSGWVDRFIMWLVSVVWAIPTLLLALAICFVLEKGFWQLFVAIGLSLWVETARIVRGQVASLREQGFAEAARALGYRSSRIMWRHILPNVISPIIVVAVANFGTAVLIESGLSFLGIGVEPPIPSWGRMIYEGYTYIMFESGQWLAFFPGAALIFLVISINLTGIGLRDALDVK